MGWKEGKKIQESHIQPCLHRSVAKTENHRAVTMPKDPKQEAFQTHKLMND